MAAGTGESVKLRIAHEIPYQIARDQVRIIPIITKTAEK